ncbi:MAG: phosphohistidine phosphatase SixA [Nitrospirota bacterium]|nr:phosphohistidine phosphatase SixA [Nitrospirota bacterium]
MRLVDCILFRHGIAVEWSDWSGDDKDRPLTEEGMAKTSKGAKGLLTIGIKPTHILCSPFLRTQQTAEILKEVLKFSGTLQFCSELFSEASPRQILSLIETLPQSSCVLCVGHEPHLGNTAAVMLCGQPLNGLSMKKAGACLIQFHGRAEPGVGTLQWWLAPSQLRSLGKS